MSFLSAIATNLNNWWNNPTTTSSMAFLQNLPLSTGLGETFSSDGYHATEYWSAKIQLDKTEGTQLIRNKQINITTQYNNNTSLMNYGTTAPGTWEPVTPILGAFQPRYMRSDGHVNATQTTGIYTHGSLPCTVTWNTDIGAKQFLVILTRFGLKRTSTWTDYFNDIFFETCRGNTGTFDICLRYGVTSPPSSLQVFYKILYAYTCPCNGGGDTNTGLTFYGNSSYTTFTGISTPGSNTRYYQLGSVTCPGYPGTLVFWFDTNASEGP